VFRTFAEHGYVGADLHCPIGSLVPAPVAGVIVFTGWVGPRDASKKSSLGYSIVLHDPRLGETWLLGHGTGRYLVRVGFVVVPSQALMQSGNSGYSRGPHVHCERWEGALWPRKGRFLDPLEGTRWASGPRTAPTPRAPIGGAGVRARPGALPRGWFAR